MQEGYSFIEGCRIQPRFKDEQSAWIATDEGILKFDRRRNTWRHFTTEDGLLDNTVQTILLDGDYVWLGTPQGATRFYWNDPYRID